MSRNALAHLPDGLGALTQLTHLNIANCCLTVSAHRPSYVALTLLRIIRQCPRVHKGAYGSVLTTSSDHLRVPCWTSLCVHRSYQTRSPASKPWSN